MLASLKGNNSFNRFLTFTSLIQMDTSNTQAVSANLRLTYNYRPDRDLYIIYNVGTQFVSTLFVYFLVTLQSCFQTWTALQLEILALRHQINVFRRSQRGRVRLTQVDRLLWAWLLDRWSDGRSALIIVRPETAMAWNRRGFRRYWTWKGIQGRPGRPELSHEVRGLIRKMNVANPLWRAPRIHGELLKL